METLRAAARRPRAGATWLGVLLTAAALGVLAALLAQGDWQGVLEPLAGARGEWFVLALALALAVEVGKAVRWLLLLGLPFATLPRLLGLLLTARLLNAVAPLRAGDAWRIASAVRVEGRPLMAAGGSVVVEKLLDALALGGVSLTLLGTAGLGSDRLALLALAAGVGAVAMGLAGLLAWRFRWWPALDRWMSALSQLRDARILATAAVLTVAVMGTGVLVNLAVLEGLGLLDGWAAGLVMLVSAYAVGLVPAVPGQLGIFELAVAAPLMVLGFSPASSVAAALALHLVLLAVLGIGGLLAVPLGFLGSSRR